VVDKRTYDTLSDAMGVSVEIEELLGWINHSTGDFRPRTPEKIFKLGDFVHADLGGGDKTLGTIVKIEQVGKKGHRSNKSKAATAATSFHVDTTDPIDITVAVEDQPNIVINPGQVVGLSLDEVRLATGARWERQFRSWIAGDRGRREQIELAYTRTFQGYRAPKFPKDPLRITRWRGRTLHDYQTAAARRLLENQGGIAALDTGLGKTYTGAAALAMARQNGTARRPAVVVPNSLVWKWVKDFHDVLPDYNVVVIGSQKKTITRGPRKGLVTSETDTPVERAQKWKRFQGGEYDVALVTYSALPRTAMDDADVERYVDTQSAIRRQLSLRKRKGKPRKPSARQDAVQREGVAGWVAEMIELPKDWAYDPGIRWGELKIDFLMVDEGQNFKNKFMPEPREGGVPKYMGNPGAGSDRAWQLDFRAASVRAHTGGAGIYILSATPWKNSPLEVLSMVHYVDPLAFQRRKVRNPEEFIDRYLETTLKAVINAQGNLEQRSAVTGFKNLHELREVIDRYTEAKTAEDVGLAIPEAEPVRMPVDLNFAQEEKFVRLLKELRQVRLKGGNPLGLMARLNLIAIHPDLEDGYGWAASPGRPPRYENGKLVDLGERPTLDAHEHPNPHAPKIDACVAEILKQPGCGHIVFVENIAIHVWMKMALVEAGMPAHRIGTLNGQAAKASDERLRIAQAFTGTRAAINGETEIDGVPVDLSTAGPEDVVTEGVDRALDVVLVNVVGAEGADLQTETCQVHHLDLPYDPATLQQRNGRAVRQGNKRKDLPIRYYLANKSLDGFRLGLILGKRGWMEVLYKGSARRTNNPGMEADISIDDMLIEVTRDPEEAAQLREGRAQAREREAHARVHKSASATLRAAVGRYTLAREEEEPLRAETLRADADKLIASLANVDAKVWPWFSWAEHAASHPMLVTTGGAPVYETLRVGYPDPVDARRTEFIEFGAIDGQEIGARRPGSATWQTMNAEAVGKLDLRPEYATVARDQWPEEREQVRYALGEAERAFYNGASAWRALGWRNATAAFREAMWGMYGDEILARMETFATGADPFPVPVLHEPGVIGFGLLPREGKKGQPFPPTAAGWAAYLRRAVEGDSLKGAPRRSDIRDMGTWWWGLEAPPRLFRAAEFREAVRELQEEIGKPESHERNYQLVKAAITATVLGTLDEPTMQAVASAMAALTEEDAGMLASMGVQRQQAWEALQRRAAPASMPAPAPAGVPSSRAGAPSTRAGVPSSRAGAPRRITEDLVRLMGGTVVHVGDPSTRTPAAPSVRTPSVRTPAAPSVRTPAAPSVRTPASLRVVPPPPPSSVRPSVRAPVIEDEDEDLAGALELDEDFVMALELDDEDDLAAALELDDEEDLTAALALD
jgi:hypothetical protein